MQSTTKAEAGGIRLGMTRDDVVAACCKRPRVTIREIYAATDKNGQRVDPSTNKELLLGDPYLSVVTCGGGQGLTQIQFSPGPGKNTVTQIDHTAYGESIGKAPPEYLASLIAEYGAARDQVGPEIIDAARKSSARSYKWLFSRNAREADCAPRSNWRGHDEFGSNLPETGACATHLTVRIAATPQSVIAADFKLLNVSATMQAHDQYVLYLNKTYGTHFADARTAYAQATEEARKEADANRNAEEAAFRAQHPEEAAEQDRKRFEQAMVGLFVLGLAAKAASAGNGQPVSAGASPAFNAGGGSAGSDNGQWERERLQRRERCLNSCTHEFCLSGQDGYNECVNRSESNFNTCRMSCP
jgi:hypothetical protein